MSRGGSTRPPRLPGLAWAVPACLALAALSLLAPSTPSYDPWAWLVWGREIVAFDLDTRFGPSWKPLPVLFTTPFSLFGEAAPELWLIVARAGALVGLVAAFRLARRLAGAIGGVLAAAALALSDGYLRGAALGFSEGLLVALTLVAVERHLEGRRAQALALGFGAGLLRPETWPFLGLYALYVFVREPRARVLTAGLMALLPVLWLGPELWGAGDPFRAASRAQEPTRFSAAFAESPALAVLVRAAGIVPWAAKVGVVVAVVLAPLAAVAGAPLGGRARVALREWTGGRGPALVVLVLAAVAAIWFALVAIMTEAGYAGNSRYLAMPAALSCVVGGAGLGWLARALGTALERARGPREAVGRPGPRSVLVAGVVIVAAAAATAGGPLSTLAGDSREVADAARLDADLPQAIARAGGRTRVRACGQPFATALQVPAVAWQLRVATGRVGIEPRGPGTYFRGPPALQPPDVPAPPATSGGLRPIARLGEWTVSAHCR